MTSLEDEGTRVMDKFNKENFSFWKFKLEMGFRLVSIDLWGIVDKSEEAPPSNIDRKSKKEYQRHVKYIFIIIVNLVDNQLAYIRSHKGLAEARKALCNIHKTKNLLNIFFIRRKHFMYKMEEGDDLLDHINKIKVVANPFVYSEVAVRN